MKNSIHAYRQSTTAFLEQEAKTVGIPLRLVLSTLPAHQKPLNMCLTSLPQSPSFDAKYQTLEVRSVQTHTPQPSSFSFLSPAVTDDVQPPIIPSEYSQPLPSKPLPVIYHIRSLSGRPPEGGSPSQVSNTKQLGSPSAVGDATLNLTEASK